MKDKSVIRKVVKSLTNDPAGFLPRATSAIAEQAGLIDFRLRTQDNGAVVHYGVHRNGNSGDTALFVSTRRLFESHFGPQSWIKLPVRSEVRHSDVDRINRYAKAVLVGGGGLIIPDSVRSSLSGWQWNISIASLRALNVPLILSGVGYNSFHGQAGFAVDFQEHVTETVRKAAFIGLRNTGSIRALSEHLPAELAAKLRYQPCPTTVLSRLFQQPEDDIVPGRNLSINLAFDRAEMRFKGGVGDCVKDIVDAAKHMSDKGWRITVAIHDPRDRFFLPLLRKFGLSFEIVDIAHAGMAEILAFYRRMDLTIGMRGHGQMVPFGLGRAIFTLSSHPKMNYFLEDIGKPEWGVDIRQPGFRDRLIAGMENVTADPENTADIIRTAQKRLWNIMQDNLTLCESYMT